MTKSRIEAFSDGVLAIIITIMVLELKVPHTADLSALFPVLPVFLSYLLSFVFMGIYWNNHHHLFQLVKHVNGKTLWANLHLLFWLSLIPFVTGWMGENHFEAWPVTMYGVILFMSAVAYYILARTLVSHHGKESDLASAMGGDFKGKISLVLYAAALPAAFTDTRISGAIYVAVALMWLVPDRRIEKLILNKDSRK